MYLVSALLFILDFAVIGSASRINLLEQNFIVPITTIIDTPWQTHNVTRNSLRYFVDDLGKWGNLTDKITLAVVLTNPYPAVDKKNELGSLIMWNELRIHMVEIMCREELLSKEQWADLVLVVTAFCEDPKTFRGKNLVEKMKAAPYATDFERSKALLALCGTGDDISRQDRDYLFDSAISQGFSKSRMMSILALVQCVESRNKKASKKLEQAMRDIIINVRIAEMTKTDLAMTLQVLMATGLQDTKLAYVIHTEILKYQFVSGAFGTQIETAEIVPVTTWRSLIDVNDQDCPALPICTAFTRDDQRCRNVTTTIGGQITKVEKQKIRVTLKIVMGDDPECKTYSNVLHVPFNSSVYSIMKRAIAIDPIRFNFTINRGPDVAEVESVGGVKANKGLCLHWALYHRASDLLMTCAHYSIGSVASNDIYGTFPADGEVVILRFQVDVGCIRKKEK